jgi:hypothetical protein
MSRCQSHRIAIPILVQAAVLDCAHLTHELRAIHQLAVDRLDGIVSDGVDRDFYQYLKRNSKRLIKRLNSLMWSAIEIETPWQWNSPDVYETVFVKTPMKMYYEGGGTGLVEAILPHYYFVER